jgi:GTP-binding protein HflX
VVEKTLSDLGCAETPTMMVFNKIDAYRWVEKEPDDLTPATRENISLDELRQTWMAQMPDSIFISAKQKQNIDELRQALYNKVRFLHVQKYPYNDFLYPMDEEQEV